jgi:hypothetical protein
MEPEQTEALLRFFKAVGQTERLQVLGELMHQAQTERELAAALGMKEKSVRRHLEQLKKAGLVLEGSIAANPTYQFNNTALERLNLIVEGKEVESHTEYVMKRYVDGRRLKEIPINPDDRMVILQWMADKFVPGKQYPESTVDAIIGRHFHKRVTLRRILVDNRLLKRSGGIYWRPLETSN